MFATSLRHVLIAAFCLSSAACARFKEESKSSDRSSEETPQGAETVSPADSSQLPPATPTPEVEKPTVPTVLGVLSLAANGAYTVDAIIAIDVHFSVPVTVTGTPILQLAVQPDARSASYMSGSGTDHLRFEYRVVAGDAAADLDYGAATSLSLQDGRVESSEGVAAHLSLADPGAPGSLGANSDVIVDTTAPSAPSSFQVEAGDAAFTLSWVSEPTTVTVGFLIVRSSGSAISWRPGAGQKHSVGDQIADDVAVVWNGGSGPIVDAGLVNLRHYRYTLFAFDSARNYSTPLTGEGSTFPRLWVPNGDVTSLAAAGQTLFVGGTFSRFGPYTGHAVMVDAATGANLSTEAASPVRGQVHAVAAAGEEWYVGGEFASVGAAPRRNLAKLGSDGRVVAWIADANGPVRALALVGTILYVGGDFTTVQGQPRNRLAAIDTTDGQLTDWAPEVDGTVRALTAVDGKVYVGGSFGLANGVSHPKLVAFDESGAVQAFDLGLDGAVNVLLSVGTKVYVGGNFTTFGGAARTFLAAFQPSDGSVAPGFGATADGPVYGLAASATRLFVGGVFQNLSGAARSFVGAVDLVTGAAVAGWNPGANAEVFALSVANDVVYAGGAFTTIGSTTRIKAAALAAGSGEVHSFAPDASGDVMALAPAGSKVLLGGLFNSVGTHQDVSRLTAIDLLTGRPTSWNPAPNSSVLALLIHQGKLYVGGAFTAMGLTERKRLAAFDLASGALEAWNPVVENNVVLSLAAEGDTVYAGGSFSLVAGETRTRVAALAVADGSLSATWNHAATEQSGSPVSVSALTIAEGNLLLGGTFNRVDGSIRNYGAMVSLANAGTLTPWSPTFNGPVAAVASATARTYVGGAFSLVSGSARSNLAAIDSAGFPVADYLPSLNGEVKTLLAMDQDLIVGGAFSNVNGVSQAGVAVLNGTGNSVVGPWTEAVKSGTVQTVAVHLGYLFLGGSFQTGQTGRGEGLSVVALP